MSFFRARITSLLARVCMPIRRLTCSDSADVGAPDLVSAILNDNLIRREHGRTVLLADDASRLRLRRRMLPGTMADRLPRATATNAHSINSIEGDAARAGDLPDGRRRAGPCGRRMRRDHPNDRRPTRTAAGRSSACHGAGRRRRRAHAGSAGRGG